MSARRLLTVVLLMSVTACTSMQPIARPAEYIRAERPERVRVIMDNGAVRALDNPTVFNDQLVGREPPLADSVALPLARIQRIETRQRSSSRTLWLGIGIAAVVAAVAVIVTIDKGGSSTQACGEDFNLPPC